MGRKIERFFNLQYCCEKLLCIEVASPQIFFYKPADLKDFRIHKLYKNMQGDILDQPFNQPEEKEDLEIADGGKRFINYLIDNIVSQVFAVGCVFLYLKSSGSTESDQFGELEVVLFYLAQFFYYTGMEAYFNGKTLGKFITRTRAVCLDESLFSWEKAALRSLCRFIPFEQVSFLFSEVGWHDKISKTRVVNETRNLG